MPEARSISTAALLAAIVAIVLIVFAAILFVSTDDVGTQRLALLLGIVSIVLPQLVGMLRGDLAASRLDGGFDQRVVAAVLKANFVRRTSDVTPESASPKGLEAVINPATLAPGDVGGAADAGRDQ